MNPEFGRAEFQGLYFRTAWEDEWESRITSADREALAHLGFRFDRMGDVVRTPRVTP